MRRISWLMLSCCVVALAAYSLRGMAQDAPPGGSAKGGGDAAATRPAGPPPGMHLIPPFVVDKLQLTADQKKQIAELEKATKIKLDEILTADQKRILETTRPPHRDGPPAGGGSKGGGGGQGGQGGGQGGQGGPGGQ